jgi:hypothetical protein
MIHDEAAPILNEVRNLRAEVSALRSELARRSSPLRD